MSNKHGYLADSLLRHVYHCIIEDSTEDCVWIRLSDGTQMMTVPQNIFSDREEAWEYLDKLRPWE